MKKLLQLEVLLLNELMKFKDMNDPIGDGPIPAEMYWEEMIEIREWILKQLNKIKDNE
jgi:hypothetical protein